MLSAVAGFLRGLAQLLFVVGMLGAIIVGGGLALAIAHFSQDLPDHQQLLNYVPPTGSKVYAGDGSFMAEFASERRIITPINQVPPLVVHAFLAAEDRDFYSHNGVNPGSVLRAALTDIVRFGRGQRPLGASTITQQVVRHFLLTNEVSVARKIKEALLAYRIENQLSKDRILEIYLNEIYFGAGAYGVAAAADTYFGKPLDQLSIAEAAFLAALPKAPNNYNPAHHPQAAKARRDWVIDGMAEQGWIGATAAQAAKQQPLDAVARGPAPEPEGAGYFTEQVRRELIERFGEKTVYEGGLTVRTSYVPSYQAMAERAFHSGLVEYDRRHGWRGPLQHLGSVVLAQNALYAMPEQATIPGWRLAAVTGVDSGGANILLKSGMAGRIPLDELRWARRTLPDQRLGAAIYRAQQVLSPGDIVLVEPLGAAAAAPVAPVQARRAPSLLYALRQVPDVSGGFVALDPKTGRVFAIVGGWDYRESQFDRAIQAKRQPGSAIKPFVYVTALGADFGYTPSSIIEDAPISLPQGPGLPMWTPVNYEGNYVGQTTLRQALVHSRNLATARLASQIGMAPIAKTVEQFGIMDKMPLYYSMALGAGDTTLYRLATAYAMLDNGGHWLHSSVIDLVQDRQGRIIYQKGSAACPACYIVAGPRNAPETDPAYRAAGVPDQSMIWLKGASYAERAIYYRPAKPDPMIDPIADAQIVSMMQGVVQQGTGIKVAAVGKPLAGKTGTTSDWFDAWFVGFSPDLVAGAYVGFDTPRTLGDGEVGGNVAAPIFRDFMAEALKDKPAVPFPDAPGAEMVMVNSITGQPTTAGDKDAILEPFRPGTGPATHAPAPQIAAARPADTSGDGAADAPLPGLPMAALPAAGPPVPGAPLPPMSSYAGMPTYAAVPPPGYAARPAAMPMVPVNAPLPVGTVVPPPSRVIASGTGGLY
ncbi:MAG TPA: PBP1A family penicillin-binding protein [Stellaceae bacterium]|nr:PBP1A family penicillin-binding protein [Stellaceae bacterium]